MAEECGCGKPVTFCSACSTRHFHMGLESEERSFEITICPYCDGVASWPVAQLIPGMLPRVWAAIADSQERGRIL